MRQAAAERFEVLQPGGQSAHRVVAGGAEDKGAQCVLLPIYLHVETAIQLAADTLAKRATIRSGTAHLFQSFLTATACGFAVTDTQRPTVTAVEGAVFGAQVQFTAVEQQPHGNGADLAVAGLVDQRLVQRMQ
ncbi:hypothetical protein D3C78_1630460 [compost metagenome]